MVRPLILSLSLLLLSGCGRVAPALQPLAPAPAAVRSQATATAPSEVVRALMTKYNGTHTMPTHVGSRTTTTSLTDVSVQDTATAGVLGYAGRLNVVWTSHAFDRPDQHGSSAYRVVGTYNAQSGWVFETGRTQL